MNDLSHTPTPDGVQSLHAVMLHILIALALKQPEPSRGEWLDILRKDGWL